MATSLKVISQFLQNQEIKHDLNEEEGFVVTGTKTHNYRDSEGDNHLIIVIKPIENGEYLKVFAPNCYDYPPDGPYRSELFQACLMISWMTKSIQYEYDIRDGEIRCIIEFPLEDALLTEKQLMRCLSAIVYVTDQYDEMIRKAMTTGIIDPPEVESHEDLMEAFMEFMRQRKANKAPESRSAGIDLEE